MFNFFLLIGFFSGYFFLFDKKILSLMALEGFVLSCFFIFYNYNINANSSFMVLLIFSVMMVLGSVFGISILIYESRSSFNTNFFFKFF